MRSQMDIGLKKNMIPMVIKSIMRIQMNIGIKVNLIPMEMKYIMKILMVKSLIIDQRNHVKTR